MVKHADDQFDVKCIAAPKGVRCKNVLDTKQLRGAREVIPHESDEPTIKQVRDVIACLVCLEHQQNQVYAHKKSIEHQWRDELPGLDFSPRTRSRWSLSPSRNRTRSRTHRRESSVLGTPTRSRQLIPGARSTVTTTFLDTPDRTPCHIGHNRSASEPVSYPAAHALPMIVLQSVDQSDAPHEPLVTTPGNPQDGVAMLAEWITTQTDQPTPGHTDMTLAEPHTVRSHSPTMRRRGSSTLQSFTPGDASTWARWTIRTETRALILEPLPRAKDWGCIYVVEDVATREHVKIGMTLRPFRTRLKEIAREHERNIDMTNAWHIAHIPYIQLIRLETLVHRDLAQYQRNLSVGKGNKRRTHREWFEVDMSTAQKTVQMWWDIMRHIGLEPGRELGSLVTDALNSSPAFDVDMADPAVDTGDFFDARIEHADRLDMWAGLLLSKQSDAGHTVLHSVTEWMVGYALIWTLLELLGMPLKVTYLAQAVGLAVWTRHFWGL